MVKKFGTLSIQKKAGLITQLIQTTLNKVAGGYTALNDLSTLTERELLVSEVATVMQINLFRHRFVWQTVI